MERINMKLRRFTVKRFTHILNLLVELIPRIWVADKPKGYYRIMSLEEWLNGIYYHIEAIFKGYIECYTFEDESSI